ncbi:Fic/DOC family protein [Paenibacillus fonticola]|uniref:Fic/DOC family protein n=1 Tax=Paenibacillus fonticola TaxID=379896 RepID=UPI000365D4BA|nr:Fic family protein [Paenibacillus fonticola]
MYDYDESPYFYPGTEVLINIPGLRVQKQLDAYERLVTADRLRILALKPLKGSFNLKLLCDIHRFIFKDVYPFAGKLREEDISKGSFRFAHVKFLLEQTNQLLSKLRQEKILKGLSKAVFIDRLTYYLTELNVLHPFREGNGRVQREFFRCLALESGYSINWANADADKILDAMIKSPFNSTRLRNVLTLLIEEMEQP